MRYTLLFASLLACAPAFASSVSVSPVVVREDATDKTAIVTLHNRGKDTATYQVELYKWTQDASGAQLRTPTREVLSAPIVEIAPGAKRVVRLMRQGTGSAAYRMMLREVVEKQPGFTGLQMAVNYRVPLVFEATDGQVALTGSKVAGGVLLHNTGDKAAQLTSIGPANGKPLKVGPVGWVLPGSSLKLSYDLSGPVALTVNGKPQVIQVQ